MLSDKPFLFKLVFELSTNNQIDINNNKPLSDLIKTNTKSFYDLVNNKNDSLNEIKLKFYYLNAKTIDGILYEEENTIKIDLNNFNVKNISNYYYLVLLIEENDEIINYEYETKIIFELYNQKSKGIIYDLLVYKIVEKLIKNIKESQSDDIEIEENKLNEFNTENEKKINKDFLENLKKYNLIYDEETIKDISFNDLYSNLIIQLLMKSGKMEEKNKEDEELFSELIKEIDLENIIVTESMINKIREFFEDEEENNKYKISNNDEINNDKINFYYNLFKYILKNSFHVYHIPFLKNIRDNIKKDSIDFSKLDTEILKNTRLKYIIDFICDTNYYTEKKNILLLNELDRRENSMITIIGNPQSLSNSSISNSTENYQKKEEKKKDFKRKKLKYKIFDFNRVIEDENKETKILNNGYILIVDKNNNKKIYNKQLEKVYDDIDEDIQKKEKYIGDESISFSLYQNKTILLFESSKEKINSKIFSKINLHLNQYFKMNEPNEYLILAEDGIYHLNLPLKYDKTEIIKPIDEDKSIKYNSYVKISDNYYGFTTNSKYNNGKNLLRFYDFKSNTFTNNIQDITNKYSFTTCENGLYLIDTSETYKILLCACETDRENEENGILIQQIIGNMNKLTVPTFENTDDFQVTCFCGINNKYKNCQFILVGGFEINKRRGMIKLYKVSFDPKKEEVKIHFIQDLIEDYSKFDDFIGKINKIMLDKDDNKKIIISCLFGGVYQFSLYLDDDYFNFYQNNLIKT